MLVLALVQLYMVLNFVRADNNYTTTDVSNDLCDTQLQYIERNFNEGALWARKLYDSWGKMPSGKYSGNNFDFGSFDQCIQFKHESSTVGEIRGQHCTIMFPYDLEEVDLRIRFAPQPYV